MNSILTKCIAELKNEAPRIEYVLGMLETLVEMHVPVSPPPIGGQAAYAVPPATAAAEDTNPILDAYASGPIGNIG